MTVRSNIRNLPDMNAKTPPTEEEVEQRYKDNNENDEWYKLADADVAAYNGLLDKYKTVDALSKYGTSRVIQWEKSTLQLKKDIAATIMALRKQYTSSKGEFPDWDGRTQAYKQAKRRMLQNSGVPQNTLIAIENAVRYHVQNLMVKVAPKKELEVLGVLTVSRRERQNERQNDQKNETAPPESTTPETPPTGVTSVVVEPKPGENQALFLMMVARDNLKRVFESKDLLKADQQKMAELIEEIHATTVKIGERMAESLEKANKRKAQAAARKVASEAATEDASAA